MGATYAWTMIGGTIDSLPPFGNSISYTATDPTSVTIDVTITDGNGCISSSQSVISVNPNPDCTITAADSVSHSPVQIEPGYPAVIRDASGRDDPQQCRHEVVSPGADRTAEDQAVAGRDVPGKLLGIDSQPVQYRSLLGVGRLVVVQGALVVSPPYLLTKCLTTSCLLLSLFASLVFSGLRLAPRLETQDDFRGRLPR